MLFIDSNNQIDSQSASNDDNNRPPESIVFDSMALDPIHLPFPPIDQNNKRLSNKTDQDNAFPRSFRSSKHISDFLDDVPIGNSNYNNSQDALNLLIPPVDNQSDPKDLSDFDETFYSMDLGNDSIIHKSLSIDNNYPTNQFFSAHVEIPPENPHDDFNSILQTLFTYPEFQHKFIDIFRKFVNYESINYVNKNDIYIMTLEKSFSYLRDENEKMDIIKSLYEYMKTPLDENAETNYEEIIKYLCLNNLSKVTLNNEDENTPINNSKKSQETEVSLTMGNSIKNCEDIQQNDHLKKSSVIDDNKKEMIFDTSIPQTSYFASSEIHLFEEKLENNFLVKSIKQIIELNKENKIYVLLGLLFSCTLFRNFMIDLYKNNEVKKMFEKFALVDVGIVVNNICILYDHIIDGKQISFDFKSDNNWEIHECFNYIFENIKLITESKDFGKTIESTCFSNTKLICDYFYVRVQFKTLCKTCKDTLNWEDSFSHLWLKLPQNESSVSLEKYLIEKFHLEENYQKEKKCCENPEVVLTRKLIHVSNFLFICFDEQTRNNSQHSNLQCDSIIKLHTSTGQVTYSLISLIDQNISNMYNLNFLGNSNKWLAYHSSKRSEDSEILPKHTVGYLFKKLD